MSRLNRNLMIVVAVLLVFSALTYRQSVTRADRFQRGQIFLANLNPDEIAKVELVQGEDRVTLARQGDLFVVVEKEGYPASNSAVNRLLRGLLEIGLEQEVGSGKDLASELGIDPVGEETTEIALFDSTGKEMVRVRIGKAFEDGAGRYVKRLDGEGSPIYLTTGALSLSADASSYLEKEILDQDRSRVVRIEGRDFELIREEDETQLRLAGAKDGIDLKTSEVNRLQGLVSGLRFDQVYLSDDSEVADLVFERAVTVDLDDGSGYVFSVASRDDRSFVRLQGFHTVTQVAITRDESEEELAEKAEVLTRADEIEDFNKFHGSWTYELGDWAAESLDLSRSDLIENSSS
ncbi:MAG: DUF4340 domain-containing protein [Acidobacteriota bacterium]